MIDHPALARLAQQMRANPTITSIGAPPERHAERVVDEMIAWLHRADSYISASGPSIVDLTRMGGPRGQQREFDKIKKRFGPLMLNYDFETAKRGRFILSLTLWCVWDQARNAPVAPGDPVPPGAGLAAAVQTLEGKGYFRKWRVWPVFGLTRHACVRLAQRADVRTAQDLINAMRQVWDVAMPVLMEEGGPRGCVRPLRPGPDSPLLVFEPHRERKTMLVVKTILAPGMDPTFHPSAQ